MNTKDIISSITIIVSLSSILIAILSYKISRRNATRDTFFLCFGKYLDVMKTKSNAIKENKAELAEAYYRELFDLLWTEFNLFQRKLIEKETYKRWLSARYKEFVNNSPGIGVFDKIKYKNEWEKLKEFYFDKDDPFIEHMDAVHKGFLNDAIKNVKKRKL